MRYKTLLTQVLLGAVAVSIAQSQETPLPPSPDPVPFGALETDTIPPPPTSEPPAFPAGYVLHPDTNGVMKLWKVAGSITVTNTPPPVKVFTVQPLQDGQPHPVSLSVNCEEDHRFYRLRIIGDDGGDSWNTTIVPEYRTSLTDTNWIMSDVVFSVMALNTNAEWRIRAALENKQ